MILHPRLKLFLLVMAFILPMMLAALLYFNIDKITFATSNAGTLLTPPLQSESLHLATSAGQPWAPQQKWWIVYYTPDVCDTDCVFNVEKIDSVRSALGREIDRAQTLLISTETVTSPIEGVASMQLNPTVFENLPASEFATLFAAPVIFIIDPQGYIILTYDPKTPGNAILRDLRHLLKVSQVG